MTRILFVLFVLTCAVTAAHAETDGSTEDAKEHIFPLMADLVKDRPEVPPPYGVSVVANWVDTDWEFKSAQVGIDDPSLPVQAASNSDANIRITTSGLKGDIWVLPFLDVFFVAGRAHGDNQLILRGVPLNLVPPVDGDVVVDFQLDGNYYTLGGVLAGGYKGFFSSVDFSATRTDFGKKEDVSADQSATYSVAPRIGYVVGLSQIWLGGRYFNYSTRYVGAIPLPGGQQFSFDVDLDTISWNMTAGMRTVIKKHWEVLLETGVGARHMITGSLGYRW